MSRAEQTSYTSVIPIIMQDLVLVECGGTLGLWNKIFKPVEITIVTRSQSFIFFIGEGEWEGEGKTAK